MLKDCSKQGLEELHLICLDWMLTTLIHNYFMTSHLHRVCLCLFGLQVAIHHVLDDRSDL